MECDVTDTQFRNTDCQQMMLNRLCGPVCVCVAVAAAGGTSTEKNAQSRLDRTYMNVSLRSSITYYYYLTNVIKRCRE